MGLFLALVSLVAACTGAIASVSAVGIGSILTPLMATKYDIRTAVAAAAIPHAAAMLLRFWRLRRDLDRSVLLGFGLMNAAGALVGVLLQSVTNTRALTGILAVILVVVGIAGVSGLSGCLRLSRPASWIAGALSGGFGGLVGSQGPLRSAAMLGLGIRKEAFVATATAIGLAVDGVRLPLYMAVRGSEMLAAWPVIVAATATVLIGTLVGESALRKIPERMFGRIVSGIIGAIGVLLLRSL